MTRRLVQVTFINPLHLALCGSCIDVCVPVKGMLFPGWPGRESSGRVTICRSVCTLDLSCVFNYETSLCSAGKKNKAAI